MYALNLDDTWRHRQHYQPYFCEENVWQLLQAEGLPQPRAAVFVTNATRTVAMWGQRAGRPDPVVWDYHVVLLLPKEGLILDLDDRDQLIWPVRNWLGHAFRAEAPDLQPRFRIVAGEEFLARFSSDRSHMRDARQRPVQPFPDWPAPFDPARGMNLMRFVDLKDAIAGIVVDADGLLRCVQS